MAFSYHFPQAVLPMVGRSSVKFPTFNYSRKTYVRQAKIENLFHFVESTQKENAKICVKIIRYYTKAADLSERAAAQTHSMQRVILLLILSPLKS